MPTDLALRAGTYFSNPRVRELIAEMSTGPVSRQRVDSALSGTGFSVEQLERVKLIRAQNDRYAIGFNYFTAADMRAVLAEAQKTVPSLVRAYLDHSSEFTRLLRRYPVRSVREDRLRFVIIAGFSLNWDGLNITAAEGFRSAVLVEGPGFHYSFWAAEEVAEHDTHAYYWGSTTAPIDGFNYATNPVHYAFSSFGDPYSDPRMNFPDLLLTSAEEMAPRVRAAAASLGFVHDTSFGGDFKNVIGFERARVFGAILFALRTRPRRSSQIAVAIRAREPVEPYLRVLEETGYVARDESGTYRLLVPVFDEQDRAMLDEVMLLSKHIITRWLRAHYADIRRDLGTLSSVRSGVPFESLFTQIWHELFGLTTRELVRDGFLFDPRGPTVRFKGSYPTLWRHDLVKYATP